METVLKQFQDAASEIGEGAGRKFPAQLKALGGEYARSRREAGASWDEIARELGVVVPTAQRWAKVERTIPATFHRVALVERVRRETYSAMLGGLRIEGLDLDAIVAIAKALS